MKALQIILSVLFVAFSFLFGAFLGISDYNKMIQSPARQAEKFVVYPLPQIISPKPETKIAGSQDIEVVAPGAKALYLSGKNKDGESITESDTAVADGLGIFKWDTSEYANGTYYLYVTAYYQTGAPSKTAIQLTVDNQAAANPILENSKVLASVPKTDPEKALAKSEFSSQDELQKLEIDKNLRVNKLEAGQSGDKFQVAVEGFANPGTEINVHVFSKVDAKSVKAGDDGRWQATFELEGGRHQIYAVAGGKRSVVGEVYLAQATADAKAPSREELKQNMVKFGIYAGAPSFLAVCLLWIVGIVFSRRNGVK